MASGIGQQRFALWSARPSRLEIAVRELNVRLQTELNPARADEPVVEKFGWRFRVRDKVIQTENNDDKDVFNGDIGQIVKIDPVERRSLCGLTSGRSFAILASWTRSRWPTPSRSTNRRVQSFLRS